MTTCYTVIGAKEARDMARAPKDWSGFTKGELTLTEPAPRITERGKPQWMAVCTCGGGRVVDPWEVSRGRVKTCGKCLETTRHLGRYTKGSPAALGGKDLVRSYLLYTRSTSLPQGLDLAAYADLVTTTCLLCGVAPEAPATHSLRVSHPAPSYTIVDLVPVCPSCARLLRYVTPAEGLAIAHSWVTHTGPLGD